MYAPSHKKPSMVKFHSMFPGIVGPSLIRQEAGLKGSACNTDSLIPAPGVVNAEVGNMEKGEKDRPGRYETCSRSTPSRSYHGTMPHTLFKRSPTPMLWDTRALTSRVVACNAGLSTQQVHWLGHNHRLSVYPCHDQRMRTKRTKVL